MGWALLAAGGCICALNFYLSFLRYLLFLARGGSREDYRFVSGFPLVGSLFVVIAWAVWLRPRHSLVVDCVAAVLVLIDTGGVHWFAWATLREWARGRHP